MTNSVTEGFPWTCKFLRQGTDVFQGSLLLFPTTRASARANNNSSLRLGFDALGTILHKPQKKRDPQGAGASGF